MGGISIVRSAWRLAVAGVLVLGVWGPVVAEFWEGVAAVYEGRYRTAYKVFLPPAQAGDASAQNSLGELYDKGQGMPQDQAEAVEWYRKAAEQG